MNGNLVKQEDREKKERMRKRKKKVSEAGETKRQREEIAVARVEDGVGGGERKGNIEQEERVASDLTNKVQEQHLLVVNTLLIEMSIKECFHCTRDMVSCDQVTHTGQCLFAC